MGVKENAKNVDTWIRGLFILIFGVIFYFLYILIWLLVVFQFVMKVLTGELNERLFELSDGLSKYAYHILCYITFKSEEKPYPFSPWPDAPDARPAEDKIPTRRKRSKKTVKKSATNKAG